ncbi:glycosyltransferase family 39 protein [Candidatus Gottesmanbacteria bacterium]|nr:glycosyltransferase family 39 protein [Candidatus Gottesmanbacteria bacterium]
MKKYLPGILIAVLFFIVQILTFSSYGIDPDSPFHFLRGQAYLHILTNRGQKFDQPDFLSPVLFAPRQRISLYSLNSWEGVSDNIRPIGEYPGGKSIQSVFKNYQLAKGRESFYKHNIWNSDIFNTDVGHPPVSDILSAITNRVFFEKLGLLPDIEAYHLYSVLCATLAVFVIYVFTRHAFGKFAAILASSVLALYPSFFAESHFNIKDIPEMSFFAIALISFYFWVYSRKKLWFIAFTISFFLALGTKLNIVFLPIILIIWLLSIIKTEVFKKWFSKKTLAYAAIFVIFNLGLLIALWPFLWTDTVTKFISILAFYKEVGAKDLNVQLAPHFGLPFGGNAAGIILAATTAPIATLILSAIGLAILVASVKKHHESILLISWIAIPILRVTFISTDIFGSIRQFAEFLPAMAIMAGVGGNYIATKLSNIFHLSWQLITQLLIIGYIFILVFMNISYHPNQNVFFNSLAGGVKGAWDRRILDWQTGNGNPYRQAVSWLNDYAPKNAKLAYLDGTMTSISPLWLRDDILIGSYFSGLAQKGEYIISVVYPNPPKVFPYLYLERFLDPVYEIKVDGTVITKIWQNDPRYIKPLLRKTQIISPPQRPNFGQDTPGSYWQIDLGKKYQLISITMQVPEENCSKNEGIFFLDDFFVPFRIDKGEEISEFYFPAYETTSVRFYPLSDNSCFKDGKIKSISVI